MTVPGWDRKARGGRVEAGPKAPGIGAGQGGREGGKAGRRRAGTHMRCPSCGPDRGGAGGCRRERGACRKTERRRQVPMHRPKPASNALRRRRGCPPHMEIPTVRAHHSTAATLRRRGATLKCRCRAGAAKLRPFHVAAMKGCVAVCMPVRAYVRTHTHAHAHARTLAAPATAPTFTHTGAHGRPHCHASPHTCACARLRVCAPRTRRMGWV